MVMAAIGTGATAYIVQPVLDDIFINKDEELLKILPLVVIFFYFLKGFGKYIQVLYTEYIGQDIIRRLRDSMLKSILNMDMGFFYSKRSGELISRLTNDINRIRTVVANMIPELLRESLTIVVLTAVVIYQSPKLAFYFLIVMPLAIYPLSRLAKRMKKLSRLSQEKISDLTAHLSQIFQNAEIIKANATEPYELKKFNAYNQDFFQLTMKSVKTSELVSPFMELLGAVVVAIVIIVGGLEVIEDRMSVGAFFSFMTALFMLYTPIKKVSSIYNKLQDAISAGERVFEIIDNRPTIQSGKMRVDRRIEHIAFKEVALKYDEKEALRSVSFEAKRGQIVSLVGESGAGKSSIVNMIVRFFEANQGEIFINQTSIKDIELTSLRQSIAIVTQRVYIFNDTIAQNVAYGQEIDEARVVEALKKAYAYEFVSALEAGIHTLLDENGSNLSGGQRQRIALARAFYKEPQIVIFDEATSALDSKSQEYISRAIKEFAKTRLTLIIAHRLSTIQNSDKILFVENGAIVCEGSHEELLTNCAHYQKISQKLYLDKE